MNPQQISELWEACRDGQAGDEQRRELQAYLAAHPEQAALWEAESGWLARLAPPPTADRQDFTARTLAAWNREREGWLRRRYWARQVSRMAAAVALLVGLAGTWLLLTRPGEPAAVGPAASARDPLTLIMDDLHQQMDERPQAWRAAVRRLQQQADPQWLVRQAGLEVQPQRYLEPWGRYFQAPGPAGRPAGSDTAIRAGRGERP